MNYTALIFVLLLLPSHVHSYQGETMLQTIKNYLYSLGSTLNTQRIYYTKKCILSRARAYMSTDIAACKSFEDIEKAFRNKEEQLLAHIKDTFNIPQQEMDNFIQTIEQFKQDAKTNKYLDPITSVIHDEKINPELMQKICHILQANGINPETVNIISDIEFFATYAGLTAYTRDPYADSEWCGVTRWKKGDTFFGINLNTLNQLTNLTLYHETIHLQEVHITQRVELLRLIIRYNPTLSVAQVENHPIFRTWFRFHELMGYILPVIRFPDLLLPELFMFCTEACTPVKTFVILLMFAEWNKSPELFAYPAIEELLPWYIKIEEIYKETQKTL